jgi:5-oxoprolinase (ATP-hydrolysing) subunit A
MRPTMDINCDLGEGQGNDAAILPFVTSANVACGLHAGGPTEMRRTVDEAAGLGVAVGAHPGFADRAGFGRVERDLPPEEIYDLVAYQIGALAVFIRRAGIGLAHVKAHGALYHLAGRRDEVAEAVVRAVRETAGAVIVVGAPGSALEPAARRHGLRFAAEGFADRSYGDDGQLVPRGQDQALVSGDDEVVAARAVALVVDGRVTTVGGRQLALSVQTLCLHGDDPAVVGRARAVRRALAAAGVDVAPLAAGKRVPLYGAWGEGGFPAGAPRGRCGTP